MKQGHEAFKNQESVGFKSRHQRNLFNEAGQPAVIIAPLLAAGGVIWATINIKSKVSEFRANRKQKNFEKNIPPSSRF